MHAIQILAKQYRNKMKRKTREGDKSFWYHEKDTIETNIDLELQHLIHSAHGYMFPDDYKHEYVVDALDALIDADINVDEALDDIDFYEILEGIEADVYHSQLCAWLVSSLYRIGYTDDAKNEIGISENDSIIDLISYGQLREKNEVYSIVYQKLIEILNDRAEEGEKSEGEEELTDGA